VDGTQDIFDALDNVGLERISAPIPGFLSSGSTLIDLAISDRVPGGFPIGRMSQIFGDFSTGKSLLAMEIARSIQDLGGKAVIAESEGAFNEARAEGIFGLALDDLVVPVHTVEVLFGEIIPSLAEESSKADKPVCLIVDSLTALYSALEDLKDINKREFSAKARQLSRGLEKIVSLCSQSGLTIIFVDQVRENIGASAFGKKTKPSGGRALPFYVHTRIELKHVGRIKTGENITGVEIECEVVKNRVAPPFRKVRARVLFDYGLDDIGSNLKWLKDHKDKMFGKYDQLPAAIKRVEQENLELDLMKQVQTVWRQVHAPLDRKKKVRPQHENNS
jgi:recombination protein RecA